MAVTIENKTAALMARLWEKNKPLMLERLAVLEQASGEIVAGALSPNMRTEASSAAHKLAGSLGMFGYDDGTRIARELELLLEAPGDVDGHSVVGLVGEMRESVFARP